MQERHLDRKRYFQEQGVTTEKYVIPYIEDVVPVHKDIRVLEIGCGEGGNLVPFLKMGCEGVGVDINDKQIKNAKIFVDEILPDARAKFISQNIYDVTSDDIGKFDLIMLRDVIEHIPNQEVFIKHLKTFLKPEGKVFFGFPPWCMPFGGHQQICRSKFLSKVPYFHLLNRVLYKLILKSFGESNGTIANLIEIKDTGISINRFQNIINTNDYQFDKKTFYLINPNYETKFGLKSRVQFKLIQSIPFIRDFFTTCYYCVISDKMPLQNQT